MSGGGAAAPAQVRVPLERWPRWVANFETRHGATTLTTRDGALHGLADDGSTFTAHLPLGSPYDGEAGVSALGEAAPVTGEWGVLLVRKGGFAVARLTGAELVASKVGQRHVQGRTKAGGQSQQRFARRRDNQARQAYEAAADHAARLLGDLHGPLVTGGDHAAVDEVLTDARLAHVRVVDEWHAVPDPRRAVLDQVVADAQALRVEVVNA